MVTVSHSKEFFELDLKFSFIWEYLIYEEVLIAINLTH